MVSTPDLPVDRMAFRRGDERTAPLHQEVRLAFMQVDEWFKGFSKSHALDGRSSAMVRTKLDEAIMWANRAVALTNDIDPEPERPTKS